MLVVSWVSSFFPPPAFLSWWFALLFSRFSSHSRIGAALEGPRLESRPFLPLFVFSCLHVYLCFIGFSRRAAHRRHRTCAFLSLPSFGLTIVVSVMWPLSIGLMSKSFSVPVFMQCFCTSISSCLVILSCMSLICCQVVMSVLCRYYRNCIVISLSYDMYLLFIALCFCSFVSLLVSCYYYYYGVVLQRLAK